jgi:predicted GIY-YIG superfamily endonuclease
MEYIYILECQQNKYFIGKTYNIQIEYNEHLDGTFCNLTNEFKPLSIHCILDINTNININIVIAKYILKYGKENIYFIDEPYINKKDIKNILKSKDKSCICNKSDHWINKCNLNTKDEYWGKIISKVFNNISSNLKDNGICERCGRHGHEMIDCFAKKHIDGNNISDDIDYNFI